MFVWENLWLDNFHLAKIEKIRWRGRKWKVVDEENHRISADIFNLSSFGINRVLMEQMTASKKILWEMKWKLWSLLYERKVKSGENHQRSNWKSSFTRLPSTNFFFIHFIKVFLGSLNFFFLFPSQFIWIIFFTQFFFFHNGWVVGLGEVGKKF